MNSLKKSFKCMDTMNKQLDHIKSKTYSVSLI
jgi:hypothetical protein